MLKSSNHYYLNMTFPTFVNFSHIDRQFIRAFVCHYLPHYYYHYHFGVPEIVIPDQGREFFNEITRQLYLITKTEHRHRHLFYVIIDVDIH